MAVKEKYERGDDDKLVARLWNHSKGIILTLITISTLVIKL